jgi:hypothetical protein
MRLLEMPHPTMPQNAPAVIFVARNCPQLPILSGTAFAQSAIFRIALSLLVGDLLER